jgi:hypothetical protein
MEYRAISILTGEEFGFNKMDRGTLEGLMLDEFDVYIHKNDEDYLIYYDTASDSFQYMTNHAIYGLDFQDSENLER